MKWWETALDRLGSHPVPELAGFLAGNALVALGSWTGWTTEGMAIASWGGLLTWLSFFVLLVRDHQHHDTERRWQGRLRDITRQPQDDGSRGITTD